MLRLLTALALGAFASAKDPDIILAHGRIFIGPGSFAQAVAITGNRIAQVGDDASVLALRGPKTAILDLEGRAVTPGFHDAHVHLFAGAFFLGAANLEDMGSIGEVQRRVARFALAHPKSEWLIGRGWAQSRLSDGRAPTRQDLDAVVSTRPVALTSDDGRALWLNSEALRRAGIGKQTSFQGHGRIERDKNGEPTGLLEDDALLLAARAIPAPTEADELAALRAALALARESGVTAVDSLPGIVDVPPEEQLRLWDKLYRRGEAKLRLFLYGRLEEPAAATALKKKASAIPPTRLGLVGLAGYVDGTLEDRSAALLAPYFDDEKTSGSPRYDQERLNELVGQASRLGWQVALEAGGDGAVRMSLDACEAAENAATESGDVLPDYPCRVEDAAVVSAADIPRFAALRVVASLRPGALVHDEQVHNDYPERLGDRARRAFACRSLAQAGALVSFGSAWPAASLDPRLGLFGATARQNLDGKPADGWIPDERIGLETAVEHYTLDAARAVGRGEEMGRISAGELADLVVFDRDLFQASGLGLLNAQVDVTIFDGRVVYQRAKPTHP